MRWANLFLAIARRGRRGTAAPRRRAARQHARLPLRPRRRRARRRRPSSGSTTPASASTCCATSSTPTSTSSSPSPVTSTPRRPRPRWPTACSCRTASCDDDSPRRAARGDSDLDARAGARSARDDPGLEPDPSTPLGADLHLGHVGRAEGGDLLAAPAARHRQPHGDDHGPRARRRRLRLHAAVPLQRGAWSAGRRRSCIGASVGLGPPVLRVGLAARRPPLRRDLLQLHGQAARVPPRQPEQPDDADNPLRVAFGNEGSPEVRRRVRAPVRRRGDRRVRRDRGRRRGQPRRPTSRAGALGHAPDRPCKIVDEDGNERPPAEFDADGRLANADECVGEIVNTAGAGPFEGYYNNPEATDEGDPQRLVLVGRPRLPRRRRLPLLRRSHRRLDPRRRRELPGRADRGRARHAPRRRGRRGLRRARRPGRRPGDGGARARATAPRSTRSAFAAWLDGPPDIGPKWRPRYVRVARELPTTGTNKIVKRTLVHQKFRARPRRRRRAVRARPRATTRYRPFTADDEAALRDAFVRCRPRAVLGPLTVDLVVHAPRRQAFARRGPRVAGRQPASCRRAFADARRRGRVGPRAGRPSSPPTAGSGIHWPARVRRPRRVAGARSRSSTWSTPGPARRSRSTASASTSPGPTLLAHGTDEQKQRWLPSILDAERDLVPAVQRARRRLATSRRCTTRADAGRRRLAAVGPEGVDVVRAVRPLGDLPGPHRPRRAEAPGHLVPRRRHAGAGHRGPAARADHRRGRVQRGVPRRGVRARRPPRRRAARRVGGRRTRRSPTSAARLPVQGAGRARGLPRRALRAGRASGTRSTTSRSPTGSRRRSSSCACCACTTGARCRASAAGIEPGPESSWVKLAWTDMTQHLSATALDVLGAEAPLCGHAGSASGCGRRPRRSPAARREVQRTIIGDRLLGLPRG